MYFPGALHEVVYPTSRTTGIGCNLTVGFAQMRTAVIDPHPDLYNDIPDDHTGT
jgi:hypothetical protein